MASMSVEVAVGSVTAGGTGAVTGAAGLLGNAAAGNGDDVAGPLDSGLAPGAVKGAAALGAGAATAAGR